jgi:hypothetical protein
MCCTSRMLIKSRHEEFIALENVAGEVCRALGIGAWVRGGPGAQAGEGEQEARRRRVEGAGAGVEAVTGAARERDRR